MKNHLVKCVLTVVVLTSNLSSETRDLDYKVPSVKIEVFSPKGLRASIPADRGISKFQFNAYIIRKSGQFDPRTLSQFAWLPVGSRFTVNDFDIILKEGDIVHFWVEVIYFGLTYTTGDKKFVIKEYDTDDPNLIRWIFTSVHSLICRPSVTIVNGVQQECAYRLIFEEQFREDLNTSKWTQENRFSGKPDYEFVSYMSIERVMPIKEGKLTIRPLWYENVYGVEELRREFKFGASCTGQSAEFECERSKDTFEMVPPIISAQITTKGHFSFTYGIVLIRAKVPERKWGYPQFFLDSTDHPYGSSDYNSGQMRVAFTKGDDTCKLYGGVILGADKQFRNLKMCEKLCDMNKNFSLDFHVYSLEWTPNSITLGIDNDIYCTINPEKGFGYTEVNGKPLPSADLLKTRTPIAPFDSPFHITIGMGIGGHRDFSDSIPDKPWVNFEVKAMTKFWKSTNPKFRLYPRDELVVDYVKVYSI